MKYYRLNNRITTPQIRLINEKGEHLGIVETSQALNLARERGYDLVEINPRANPPVAKLIDFGQFKYEQTKKQKEPKQKRVETKGIRLSLRVGKHDLELKINQAKKFLEEGNKVKIEMVLKGREKAHFDLAEKIINQFIEGLGEKTKIEQPLNKQGGRLTTTISR